jgi:LPXTG-motif cell wall-anchored protein
VQPSVAPSAAPSAAPGALAQPTSGSRPVTDSPSAGPGAATLWLALGAVLVALAAGLLLLRRRVRPAPPG